MTKKARIGTIAAALATASMIAAQVSSAEAFTLSSTGGEKVLPPQIERVWCRWGCGGGWGWRGGHWGFWGPAAVVGLAAGAAVAGPGPCWRRVIGPYGGVHWQRVC